jgi:hypothetical protein
MQFNLYYRQSSQTASKQREEEEPIELRRNKSFARDVLLKSFEDVRVVDMIFDRVSDGVMPSDLG